MYIWPCAIVLAQYVWFYRWHLTGKTVLEIGAGVGLPGIVAAKCGAKVILSDRAVQPHCLENCRRSCRLNNLTEIPVIGITWGQISPELLLLPPVDIIFGSDVFYEPEDFEDVVMSVYFFLQKNSNTQFWTTYQERSTDWSLEALLYKWGLKCIHIPLESFDANEDNLEVSALLGGHTIYMMVITNQRPLQE
nr:PREDICTED: methyltransferase-like protein 23 isoform X2 [Latimeria chalumnae]XP_014342261.1 PREDICTED: methyltransferase-like protein 23 isoform X2 [Latimeria chalumnae]|eukprot:XP_005993262.1 PREDICTED: methyltransferase-like protein 23 isoform X2 [Latimeria chalumnae]